MTLSEFMNIYVYAALTNKVDKNDFDSLSDSYKHEFFFVPRIYCKDGFNISIQAHHGNYCASENGVREFGLDWQMVEWGFPSQEIDGKKYNAEDCDNTTETVGGYVDVDLLNGLLDEHGGINVLMTLSHAAGLE